MLLDKFCDSGRDGSRGKDNTFRDGQAEVKVQTLDRGRGQGANENLD